MTLTPREIQEKQFHDAFRGYSHEEVDLFIDQVAESYEILYKENQTLSRRVEELKSGSGPLPAPSQPAPVPAVSPGRSESEDMLKRMLVTAQETADKAVAGAKAKAQMLVEEAEIKARRLEEQADAVSSTTLQDAQRRARDLLQAAQSEEKELRERIEGMRSFERDFRNRLAAFVRSQLELLEGRPTVSSALPGPTGSPLFDRSKLLGETVERFPDLGAVFPTERSRAPVTTVPKAEADLPSLSSWLNDPGEDQHLAARDEEPEGGGPPEESSPGPQGSGRSEAGKGSGKDTVRSKAEATQPGADGPGDERQDRDDRQDKEAATRRASSAETRSIHELFWGEE